MTDEFDLDGMTAMQAANHLIEVSQDYISFDNGSEDPEDKFREHIGNVGGALKKILRRGKSAAPFSKGMSYLQLRIMLSNMSDDELAQKALVLFDDEYLPVTNLIDRNFDEIDDMAVTFLTISQGGEQ
jgi:hypothetical protein